MRRRQPRSTRTYTLCPYTTLFRSERARTGGIIDVLEGIGLGDALRHDEGHVGRRFGERFQRQRESLLELEAEGFIIDRSEEHTSELQSLMRISYAVFCLKKKTNNQTHKVRSKSHQ